MNLTPMKNKYSKTKYSLRQHKCPKGSGYHVFLKARDEVVETLATNCVCGRTEIDEEYVMELVENELNKALNTETQSRFEYLIS